MKNLDHTITAPFGTTEPRMPDREEDNMTRILSLTLVAAMLTAVSAPAFAARHHRMMHHTMHSMRHGHSMHAMHSMHRGHGMAMRSSAAPSGEASTDQLNQQSLNQARGQ